MKVWRKDVVFCERGTWLLLVVSGLDDGRAAEMMFEALSVRVGEDLSSFESGFDEGHQLDGHGIVCALHGTV